jgi:chemotaxis protein methyltransferase CheR
MSVRARGSLDAVTVHPDSDGALEAIDGLRAWSKQQLGMTFSSEQLHVFHDRVQDLCREFECTPELLLARLRSGEHVLAQRAAEKLSTNYTFFCREPELFEYLVAQVLPTLPSGGLRLWSAAASSGDEAYSLAMTCLEFFGPSAAGRVRILGTDISERQVALAERGVYPREQTALLEATRMRRWFSEAERGQLRVNELPRQLCTFRRMNLAQPAWPFSQRFHVIFLRNVLYYFDAATRLEVLERCYDAAEDGAVLITSLTEPVQELPTRWRPVRAAVYRREARR